MLPIRQQLKNLVKSTLLTVTTTNGYEETVEDVYSDQRGQLQVKNFPAISVVDRGDRDTRLAQGIYEARMLLELRTVIEDFDRETRLPAVEQLAADCQRVIATKEVPPLNVWNGLAVQTLVQSADLHTSDASDPYGLLFLMIEILYRVQLKNPYQVALI